MLTLADMKPCRNGHTAKRYKDGRCSACAMASCKKWHAKNPSKKTEYRLKYSAARSAAFKKWCANNREHLRGIKRAWRLANVEKIRTYKRTHPWKGADPKKYAEWRREWRRKNPDRAREIKHRRRARLVGGMIDDSVKKYWPMIVTAYRGRCVYCEKEFDHMDHVIPLSRGGAHVAANVRPACAKCNHKKNAKTWTPRPWAAALRSEVA